MEATLSIDTVYAKLSKNQKLSSTLKIIEKKLKSGQSSEYHKYSYSILYILYSIQYKFSGYYWKMQFTKFNIIISLNDERKL